MKWRLLLAMSGLLTMVLVAQDVPLANYLRRVESERLITQLERDAFILAGISEDVLSGWSPIRETHRRTRRWTIVITDSSRGRPSGHPTLQGIVRAATAVDHVPASVSSTNARMREGARSALWCSASRCCGAVLAALMLAEQHHLATAPAAAHHRAPPAGDFTER
jgi:hypothetical protein